MSLANWYPSWCWQFLARAWDTRRKKKKKLSSHSWWQVLKYHTLIYHPKLESSLACATEATLVSVFVSCFLPALEQAETGAPSTEKWGSDNKNRISTELSPCLSYYLTVESHQTGLSRIHCLCRTHIWYPICKDAWWMRCQKKVVMVLICLPISVLLLQAPN